MLPARPASPTEASGVAEAGARGKPRALVTGGAGFIGSHLCEQLLAEGYRVVCMDNLRTGSLENIAHLEDEPNFEYVEHDVTTYMGIPGELDEVYHFASPPRAPRTLRASRSPSSRLAPWEPTTLWV